MKKLYDILQGNKITDIDHDIVHNKLEDIKLVN